MIAYGKRNTSTETKLGIKSPTEQSARPVERNPDQTPKERGPASKPTSKDRPPKKNPPSINQSNSGGINVQQATTGNNSPIIGSPITIGNIPKRMSPQDMATLTQYLFNAKGKGRVRIAAEQNSNAVAFADDFYKTIKNAGWSMEDAGVNEFIGFSPPGKKFQGVVVLIKGPPLGTNETVYFADPDPMFYIGQVVDALQLPHILRRDPNQAEGLITIQFEGIPD